MSIRNKVQLVGHLGANPEIRTFGDNQQVARVNIATQESYKNREGEWINETSWHTLVAWRGVALRAQKYLKKGSYIMVEGRLKSRNYTNNAGEKRYVTEVIVDNFMMLDKRESQNQQEKVENTQDYYATSVDDGLPF